MDNAALAITIVAGLAGIIVLVIPDFRDRVAAIELRRQYDWDHVRKRVAKARHRVWILQTWIPYPRQDRVVWEPLLRSKRIDFRILLIRQEIVKYRLAYRRDKVSAGKAHLENPPQLKLLVQDLAKAEALSRLEIRRYKCLPFGPIYVIDNQIYYGLYYSHMDALSGPAFRCRVKSHLGSTILDSYEQAWDQSELEIATRETEPHIVPRTFTGRDLSEALRRGPSPRQWTGSAKTLRECAVKTAPWFNRNS